MKSVYIVPACAALLAGCAVGPDFHTPESPKVAHYTALKLSTDLPTGEQKLENGAEVSAEWWRMFGSEPLDRLIEQALQNSHTVAAAKAQLLAVEENLNAQFGSVVYPSIDAKATSSRQRISGAAFGGQSRIYNLHNASLTASYGIDFFGASRRYLEGLESQVDYQKYQLQAARITLAANIVTAAIKEASLRRQISATRQIITDSEAQLQMVEQQYAVGAIARKSLLNQKTALAQARTGLPALEKQLEQNRNLLNVLVGKLPASEGLPVFTLESLHLPAKLPLSLPSELVRHRPDILAAEAMLHQASANVGVATANMYPKITLTGSYGSESPTTSNLFTPGSVVWSAGAGLLQPLFHGGELLAQKRAAVAAYKQADAQYKDVVLQAFRDVADTLLALDKDSQSLQLQRDAESAAAESLTLMKAQYKAGAASYLELLTASQQYQQASISLAQAEATRYADSAALIHALGGGWWNEGKVGHTGKNQTNDGGNSRAQAQGVNP